MTASISPPEGPPNGGKRIRYLEKNRALVNDIVESLTAHNMVPVVVANNP